MLFFLALIPFTGCDDPSNVGIGIIGDQGGVPVVRSIEAAETGADQFRYVTGGVVGTFDDQISSMLVGTVDDPQFGRISAAGHAGMLQPGNLPAGFREGSVRGVQLHFNRNYLYGDTTSVLTVTLREIAAPWDAPGARADTSLQVGEVIGSFQIDPQDTVVTFHLPEQWVQRRDTLLRASADVFRDNFHGFQLEATSGNAVVGFTPLFIDMSVLTAADSVNFPTVKTFSRVTRQGEHNLVPPVRPVQAGVGTTMSVDFDLGDLRVAALNRVELHLHADSLAMTTGVPASFVRPFPERLSLLAVTENRGEILVHTGTYNRQRSRYEFSGDTFSLVMREVLIGKDTLQRFIVRVPSLPTSINSVLLFDETHPDQGPRLRLTVVPIE